MFASILPGLREFRAPLAAGYLWLLGAWVVFEPAVPDRDEADGIVASLYRASDLLSFVGLGIVLSFAAYLLGSLSSSTLTPLLRRLFPRAWTSPPDSSDQDRSAPRIPLTPQAMAALGQIVRTSQSKVISSLAFTDLDFDKFLVDKTEMNLPDVGLPSTRDVTRGASKIQLSDVPLGPGSAVPVDLDARRTGLLARTVLRDLDGLAKTRLLGRDPELYAEVDRNRAEVEFRLAVIPPLLVLAIAVTARSDPWLLAVLPPLAALLAWGLFTDAIRAEKVANQILLQSIADRRVQSPTLEWLETEAAAQAGQQQPELMRTAAQEAVVALRAVASSLEQVGASEPSLANYARRQIDVAGEPLARVSQLFPEPVMQTARQALRLLTEAADAWIAVVEGHPARDEPRKQVETARELIGRFQDQSREAVRQAQASISSSQQPNQPAADS